MSMRRPRIKAAAILPPKRPNREGSVAAVASKQPKLEEKSELQVKSEITPTLPSLPVTPVRDEKKPACELKPEDKPVSVKDIKSEDKVATSTKPTSSIEEVAPKPPVQQELIDLNDNDLFKSPPVVTNLKRTESFSVPDIDSEKIEDFMQKCSQGPPSPVKVRQRIRPTPFFGMRRNSTQGYGSDMEDEPRRQRHTSTSSSTGPATPQRIRGPPNFQRIRTESSCSNISDYSRDHSMKTSRKNTSLDEHSRSYAARKDFMTRFCGRKLDRTVMKMSDFIYYNPSTNPMVAADPPKELQESQTKNEIEVQPKLEIVDKVEKDKEKETNMPVPQLKLGPDGELILDEQSLVIETTAEKEARETLANTKVIYMDEFTGNNGFYRRSKRTRDWPADETIKFYRCLHTVGTDFSLMLTLFPNRSRKDLKLKFKKEERINLNLVNKALLYPKTFNIAELKYELEKDEKALEAKKKELEEINKKKEQFKKITKPRFKYHSKTSQILSHGDLIYTFLEKPNENNIPNTTDEQNTLKTRRNKKSKDEKVVKEKLKKEKVMKVKKVKKEKVMKEEGDKEKGKRGRPKKEKVTKEKVVKEKKKKRAPKTSEDTIQLCKDNETDEINDPNPSCDHLEGNPDDNIDEENVEEYIQEDWIVSEENSITEISEPLSINQKEKSVTTKSEPISFDSQTVLDTVVESNETITSAHSPDNSTCIYRIDEADKQEPVVYKINKSDLSPTKVMNYKIVTCPDSETDNNLLPIGKTIQIIDANNFNGPNFELPKTDMQSSSNTNASPSTENVNETEQISNIKILPRKIEKFDNDDHDVAATSSPESQNNAALEQSFTFDQYVSTDEPNAVDLILKNAAAFGDLSIMKTEEDFEDDDDYMSSIENDFDVNPKLEEDEEDNPMVEIIAANELHEDYSEEYGAGSDECLIQVVENSEETDKVLQTVHPKSETQKTNDKTTKKTEEDEDSVEILKPAVEAAKSNIIEETHSLVDENVNNIIEKIYEHNSIEDDDKSVMVIETDEEDDEVKAPEVSSANTSEVLLYETTTNSSNARLVEQHETLNVVDNENENLDENHQEQSSKEIDAEIERFMSNDLGRILADLVNGSLVVVASEDENEKLVNEIYIMNKETGTLSDTPLDLPEDIVNCIVEELNAS